MLNLPCELEEDFSRVEELIRRTVSGEPEEALGQLRHYIGLLHHWSGRMSLVSVGDRVILGTKHLMPALAMVPLVCSLPHRTVLDFGSGAGLPGIPLKIMLPETRITLVESRRRRVSFLREVVRKLGLQGVEIINKRLEDWGGAKAGGVDLVVSRSVNQGKVLDQVRHCLAPHGAVLVSLGREGGAKGGKGVVLLEKNMSWGGGKTRLGLMA